MYNLLLKYIFYIYQKALMPTFNTSFLKFKISLKCISIVHKSSLYAEPQDFNFCPALFCALPLFHEGKEEGEMTITLSYKW
jgi:hypothetical protein